LCFQRLENVEEFPRLTAHIAVNLTWLAACMTQRGDLDLATRVAGDCWSPGDPGTGAPSFFGPRPAILQTLACAFPTVSSLYHGDRRESIMANARPRAHKGTGMEGFIAGWYARETAKDLDEFKGIARRIAAHTGAGARVLEVAPAGYLAIELVKLTGCRLVGLDISRTFVRIATENARKAGLHIDFERGDAADLPFPAEQFDFVVCRAAFKNFARPLAASTKCTACSTTGRWR
jgi:Methyltransferase domain